MKPEDRLREKRRKIDSQIAGAKTLGERAAAYAASGHLNRLQR